MSETLASANRRRATLITAHGQSLTIAEWSAQTGLNEWTIRDRLRRGWEPWRAVTVRAQRKATPPVIDVLELERLGKIARDAVATPVMGGRGTGMEANPSRDIGERLVRDLDAAGFVLRRSA